jgi:hypothetical protein
VGWTAGVLFLEGAAEGYFFSPPRPDRFWGQPTSYQRDMSGVEGLGCEADHSSLSYAEGKNGWIHISTPHTSSRTGA